MKRALKLTALMLAVVLAFSVFCVGCGKETKKSGTPINETAEYKPLMGTKQNDVWLYYNPDRGYRTEWVVPIYRSRAEHKTDGDVRNFYEDDSDEQIQKTIEKSYAMYFSNSDYTPKLVILYIGFTEYGKMDALPDRALEILQMVFDYCRLRKTKILFRCAYNGAGHGNWHYDEEYKKECEKYCADEETMIKHIKQLAPFIAKNADVVHKMSSGFIGNGEMVDAFQYPSVNFNNIIRAIVEEICVPNNLQFSVRMPEYKINLLKEYPDYQYKDIIGHNNDATFGEQTKLDMHSGGLQYKNPNGWWEYIIADATKASQSGEMFVNSAMVPNRVPTGMEVILQMAHHRFTTLSQWHTLGEKVQGYNTAERNVMMHWIEKESVTPELLEQNGILYDPNWFLDDDGIEVLRNPYEFIRDHLGYKLVAESSKLTGEVGEGCKIGVDLTFKNYGFAAAWMLESGFAILNDKYEVVSEVKAGEPEKWINLPADYYVTEKKSSAQDDVLTHNISGELTLPEEAGTYYVGFYLRNTMKDYAALSNNPESIPFEGDGFSILHKITIE